MRLEDDEQLDAMFDALVRDETMDEFQLNVADDGGSRGGTIGPTMSLERLCERMRTRLRLPDALIAHVRARALVFAASSSHDRSADCFHEASLGAAVLDRRDFARLLRRCRVPTLDAVRIDVHAAVRAAQV